MKREECVKFVDKAWSVAKIERWWRLVKRKLQIASGKSGLENQ